MKLSKVGMIQFRVVLIFGKLIGYPFLKVGWSGLILRPNIFCPEHIEHSVIGLLGG